MAIVVDSYSNVKDAIQSCQIENNVLSDMGACFLYPMLRVFRGWPKRGVLLRKIMQADVDSDGVNDEEQDASTVFDAHTLVGLGMANRASAASLMEYYRWVCPAALSSHKESGAELEHSRIFFRLKVIDSIWSRLYGPDALSEKVPQTTQSPKTKPHESNIQLKAGPRLRDKNGETNMFDLQVGIEQQLDDIRHAQQGMVEMMESLKRSTTRISKDI